MAIISNITLAHLSEICGWIYLISWTISFYPQIYENYRWKSITGMSIEFSVANLFGMMCYAIYNSCLYYNDTAQYLYRKKHHNMEHLVSIHDVLYSVHSVVMSIIILIQVHIYRKQHEGPRNQSVYLSIVMAGMFAVGVAGIVKEAFDPLEYLTLISYVKIFLTFWKQFLQVLENWNRQSTRGWSIGAVMLDFIGGVFSFLQLLIDAYLAGNVFYLKGSLSKLGLGLISVAFDVIYMLQHYIWYPEVTSIGSNSNHAQ